MKKHLIGAALVAALSGCAFIPSQDAPQKIDLINSTIPTCSTDKECAAKWEAAQYWVIRNSGYKIQTYTALIIETYNPTGTRSALAVRIVKEPMGGGKYRFTMSSTCSSVFGCSPDRLDAALDFNKTLNAIEP